MWYTVRAARVPLITAASLLVILLFVASPAVNRWIQQTYPPVTTKKLFGLMKKQAVDPRAEQSRRRAMGLLWLVSGGVVLTLFWLHIPAGIAQAAKESRKREELGDGLVDRDSIAGWTWYRKALSLAVHAEDEARLRTKISRVHPTQIEPPSSSIRELKATLQRPNHTAGTTSLPSGQHDTGLLPSIGHAGRYRLETKLGQGAMGTVYRAWDTVLDRAVAIKELPARLTSDPEYISRFRREAKALARLDHPGIVRVYDLIEDQQRLWMALELVTGGDLAGRLRAHGRLPLIDALSLGSKLAQGLAYAHRQGVIHRDFKPANVLLTEHLDPKISDFGLAKIAQSSVLTQEGAVLGSPRYMSSEQAAGAASDHRSDVYSFGVTMYELCTGQVPFDGDTATVLAQHITQPPPPPRQIASELSVELENLILAMLVKDPERRLADLCQTEHTLQAIAATLTSSSTPVVK